ncbi:pentatricopeptide repeat-containing protein At5g50390, chloroplastic [Andrographis paniculata]|uniref:pentatricopeptide repeat-containing protein At5g50390, chloroplastic n=1 Tax=Andrographis paniculata TaxID=175694 RepID=UPI0021E9477F|nr:pentatricopeptide repeat-containing protein At5g50390, chloroplastic [Andrographis paniculata]
MNFDLTDELYQHLLFDFFLCCRNLASLFHMDISLQLDQIQNSYRFACSLSNPSKFAQKFRVFEAISLGRCKATFSTRFRCSLLDQGLKPRPIPRPLKEAEIIEHGRGQLGKKIDHLKKSSFDHGICEQIEKLVQCKRYHEALEMFELLECENNRSVEISTYDALVDACISLKSIRGAKRVIYHLMNSAVDQDVYIRNRVLLMHVKCGMMIDALKLFDEMPERNLVSWNTIIAGLVDSGDYVEAFTLFFTMWEDTSDIGTRTFATLIRASAGLELIHPGQQLHACALKLGMAGDVFVSCTLIDMYSKCGSIENARCAFDKMLEKTTVAWNSIIAGYAFHGYSEEALSMYYDMQDSGAKMDGFTYSMIVRVCTRLASLEHAKQAHAGLVRNGFGSDIVANTALVDFYSKWGRIEDARNVFDKMPLKNIVSWNALIAGYGNHGRGAEAVELFHRMDCLGMVPNHVTFLAVLSACCYSGLFNIGWEIFESMSRDYKVKPRAMHYTCMVELLGREGRLYEACALIEDCPFTPTVNMWAALLTACRVHENFDLAKYAAERIYGMEPEKLSSYVVLLNIYNRDGKFQEAAAVLRTLRRKGLRMLPACTWIEIKKQQHVFFTGDKKHPQTEEIYEKLDEISKKIVEHGYVPLRKTLLPDVDEREETMLLYHSEKLAISFGIISTPDFTPLQLVQSHRICNDCHNAIKLISMVCAREIVFRDASRFHHFKDGRCSCGDYW